MNKAFCRKRVLFSFVLTGCLIFFNLSCGLDTFYVIEGPRNAIHTPDCSSIDYTESYFEFDTIDKDYDSIKFLGTDVYYKIYQSSSTLQNQVNELISVANREESTSVAALRMIESYKYQPLRGSGHDNVNVLIPTDGTNDRVTIRLSNYQDLYPAQITVNGENIYGSDSRVVPVRNLPSKPSFSFASLNADLRPKSDDADVSSSSNSPDLWYVSMFAIAIGQDETYSPVYSNILYLGSVQIPAR